MTRRPTRPIEVRTDDALARRGVAALAGPPALTAYVTRARMTQWFTLRFPARLDRAMDMPRPGPAHARLMRFAGRWSGDEQLAPSPWGPGGAATGRTRCQPSLDGMALIQDYEEEKDGQVVFHGHGVFLIEPGSEAVLWWWFDSMGFPPEPARGKWDGDVLSFEKVTPRGAARYRYEFDGDDRYRFVIENRFMLPDSAEQTDFVEFMHGDYTRSE